MATSILELEHDEILYRAGDTDMSLYKIHEGELFVFVVKGSQITPLAYLGVGEYVGELSYFDDQPASAYVVATKKTTLKKIPKSLLKKHFPPWLHQLAIDITTKLRTTDELIRLKGIRKKKIEGIKPLDIEQQSHYYQLTQEEP